MKSSPLPCRILAGFCAAAVIWFTGCSSQEKQQAERQAKIDDAHERAVQAVDLLMQNLSKELQEALMEGGPINAITVCSDIAPAKTLEIQESLNLKIRRTSTRVRNPANQPDDTERSQLQHWSRDEGEPPVYVSVLTDDKGGSHLRYMQPILLQDTCLPCHGPEEQIDPGVKQLLADKYPDDAAVGFEVGQLRGAISVSVSIPD